MQIEATEVIWLEQHELSLPELSELSGLPKTLLEQLMDSGAIAPVARRRDQEVRFGAAALHVARTARRLQTDFELDMDALTLALGLLDRIAELEAQIQALRARLPQGAQP
jgi:hypothetical protein